MSRGAGVEYSCPAAEADEAYEWSSPLADDDAWVQRGQDMIRDFLPTSGSTVFQDNSIWDGFERDSGRWTVDS